MIRKLTPFFPSTVRQAIQDHVQAGYPAEVCGAWYLTCHGEWQVRPWINQQPSSLARHSFVVHPLDILSLLQAQDRGELVWKGMYHSHPNMAPFLSAQDLDALLFQGVPSYPDVQVLVVGISRRDGRDELSWSLYEWDTCHPEDPAPSIFP